MQGCDTQDAKATAPAGAQVRQVLDDVEDYLGGWMARLQRVLDQCQTAASREAELLRRMAAFDQQVQQWQTQRQREMQQIHQGSEQLADAWQRLEAEQRRWLSGRQASQPDVHPDVHPDSHAAPRAAGQNMQREAAAGAVTAADSGLPERSPTAIHQTGSPVPAAAPPRVLSEDTSRELAVRQFEMLRREVGQYSRSHR